MVENIKKEKLPVRVLHVLTGLDMGGTEMFVMNLYRAIDKTKVQFDFVIFKSENMLFEKEIIEMGGKIFRCIGRKKLKSNKIINFINSIFLLESFLKTHSYKTVHIHGCSFYLILRGTIASKISKVNTIIAHAHNVGEATNGFLDTVFRNILKHIVVITANTYFACSKEAAISKFSKSIIENNRYSVIKNAINLDRFSYDKERREKLRKKYGLENTYVIGNVGRLHYQKNQLFLLDIFKELLILKPNAKLMLVGDGELKKELFKKSESLGIYEKILFMGMVENTEDLYLCMDVFVFPSIYEGLGIVAIEAQATGLLCIVSDMVPKESQVTKNIHYLSLKLSEKEWAEKILYYEQNFDRKSQKENVQKAGYDIDTMSNDLMHFYLNCYN